MLTDANSRPAVFTFPGAASNQSLGDLCSACTLALDLREVPYPDWRRLCESGTSFADAIDTLAHEVILRAPAGEIRVAGYSIGGEIAFWVARAIRRLGRGVALVVVVNSKAPGAVQTAANRLSGLQRTCWKLLRMLREREIKTAIILRILGLVPLRLWPIANYVLPLLPGGFRERTEIRLRATAITILKQRWEARHGAPLQPSDIPLLLLRVRGDRYEDNRYGGWASRVFDVATIMVDGDYRTVLKGAKLRALAATFASAVLSHEVSGLACVAPPPNFNYA